MTRPERLFALTSLVVLAALAAGRPSPPQVTITYLANEGVMIDCSGQKVLIDALFRDSVEDYMRHSPELQERIETGKAPFDGVRLALATQLPPGPLGRGNDLTFLA